MNLGKAIGMNLFAAIASLSGSVTASAATHSTGSCGVTVRNAAGEERRTTVALDFSQLGFVKETLATLPSGEQLKLYVNGFEDALWVIVVLEDSRGGQLLELTSGGRSLSYENYSDPRFVSIFVGCRL